MPHYRNHQQIEASLNRMEENLMKLRDMESKGESSQLWEAAGNIWGAAYWVGEFTKDQHILNQICDLREELSHLVSKKHLISKDVSGFDKSLQKIESCYREIQNKI
jgi:hypothetical protein